MTELQTWSVGIRPRSDVYSTYRRIDYKSWFAIGEFVDNATQNFCSCPESRDYRD